MGNVSRRECLLIHALHPARSTTALCLDWMSQWEGERADLIYLDRRRSFLSGYAAVDG